MKNFFIFVVVLVCLEINFSIGQRTRGIYETFSDDEDSAYGHNRLGRRGRENMSGLRLSEEIEARNAPTNMMDEFQSDVSEIRKFAQTVRPMAINTRRSMPGHTAFGTAVTIVIQMLKAAILSFVSSMEESLPALKPITKYARMLVTALFQS